MLSAKKRVFVLVSTDVGSMILSRLDFAQMPGGCAGVGIQFMEEGNYGPEELAFLKAMADSRRKSRGDGVVAVDVGANFGAFTIPLARHMDEWGEVIGIEAQERVFYALGGNITLNNAWNARAVFGVAGSTVKNHRGPVVDYGSPVNLGGVSLDAGIAEQCGQKLNYGTPLPGVTIDAFDLPRLDVIKIDVEGMEQDVIDGAARTIKWFRPLILAEWTHSAKGGRRLRLPPNLDYRVEYPGGNVVAMPREEPLWAQVVLTPSESPVSVPA
jgi:FkbM family methyltransferase